MVMVGTDEELMVAMLSGWGTSDSDNIVKLG